MFDRKKGEKKKEIINTGRWWDGDYERKRERQIGEMRGGGEGKLMNNWIS